jgi:hypothetical protein
MEELNSYPIYIDKICIRCGRKYPETILNIEGVIHHNQKYECKDRKDCKKFIKKN